MSKDKDAKLEQNIVSEMEKAVSLQLDLEIQAKSNIELKEILQDNGIQQAYLGSKLLKQHNDVFKKKRNKHQPHERKGNYGCKF